MNKEIREQVELWLSKDVDELKTMENRSNCNDYAQYLRGRVHALERVIGLDRYYDSIPSATETVQSSAGKDGGAVSC